MLPPGAIFELKIHKNAFAAGAKTPLEELTGLPSPLSCFSESCFAAGQGSGGKGRGGKESKGREEREVERSGPLLFLKFNRCS